MTDRKWEGQQAQLASVLWIFHQVNTLLAKPNNLGGNTRPLPHGRGLPGEETEDATLVGTRKELEEGWWRWTERLHYGPGVPGKRGHASVCHLFLLICLYSRISFIILLNDLFVGYYRRLICISPNRCFQIKLCMFCTRSHRNMCKLITYSRRAHFWYTVSVVNKTEHAHLNILFEG